MFSRVRAAVQSRSLKTLCGQCKLG